MGYYQDLSLAQNVENNTIRVAIAEKEKERNEYVRQCDLRNQQQWERRNWNLEICWPNIWWAWYIAAYPLEPDWHNLCIYEPWSLLPYINMHFVHVSRLNNKREREHSYTMQINQ